MPPRVPRRVALRGAAAAVLAGAGAAVVAGCTEDTGAGGPGPAGRASGRSGGHEVQVRADAGTTMLGAGTEPSVSLSRAVLARATAVVLAASGDVPTATGTARSLGIPLLVWGPDTPAELDRLAVRTVVRATRGASGASPTGTPSASGSPSRPAAPVPDDLGAREVVEASGGEVPPVEGLPLTPPSGAVVALVRSGGAVPGPLEATLDAVGARRVEVEAEDVRESADARAALRAARDAAVVAWGDRLGPQEHFAQRVRTTRAAAELPGGGLLPFPDRRMVALYGHPQTPDLGMLGEQGPAASVARVQALAAEYERLGHGPWVPAFELIATVASGSPGRDRQYSTRTSIEVLRPYVDAAEEAGLYVVLDLQPGRSDFLTQARLYEELLRRPGVGLALDPEWRLKPTQVHLKQIGSVAIEEVNEVGAWLARLVRDHDLPPKVLTLHQFDLRMIRDRSRLDTGLDEVQWLLHADGQGSQPAKQGTWAALRRTLPDGVWLGWKNFEDEDHPMLTPAQTLAQVHPTPSFVSYQ